jgi:hypothetical protein
MASLENKQLQGRIVLALDGAMLHSLTTSELCQQLKEPSWKVLTAAENLRKEGVVTMQRTNDAGRPYRLILISGMTPKGPEEETSEPWYRRVLGWFK